MSRIDTVLRVLARAMLITAAVSVVAMTLLVVVAAFMRYLVGSPFVFTEELVGLLYLLMVFLTIPICTVRLEHITVTAVVDWAGPGLRRVFRLLALLVMLIFSSWFCIESYRFAAFGRQIEARTEQASILLWPWMGVIPVAMAFVAAIVIVQIVQAWRSTGTDQSTAPSVNPGKEI